ncbi:site-specific integrase [Williamsia herbipolensis]|uniref:Site-specific integrase n=1 Tax=Williamsia herbipolensis TaxID=1603258 RepID=A0AAU4JYA2_9NOCA|nr:site-specific integrase [Williamsia herbipolensis]
MERFDRTGAAAERKLVTALRDRSRAGAADEITPDTTLAAVADLWLSSLDAGGRHTDQTISLYRSAVDRHIRPALGGVRVRETSVGTLERFLASVDGVAIAKRCRVCLSAMLGLAARHDAIKGNPVRDTTSRTTPRGERVPVRALDLAELAQLRQNVAAWSGGNHFGPPRSADMPDLFDVMLGTGGRIGEVLAIRRGDVDLAASPPTLTFTGTVVGSHRQAFGKTSTSHRTVVLPHFAAVAIRRQIARDIPTDDDLLFPSRTGGVRSTHNVRRQLRDARGDEFEWVTPHTLRKTTATTIEREVDIEAAAAQLGHSGSRVTREHYVERAAQAPDLRSALDALAPVSGGFRVGQRESAPSA